MSWNGTVRCGNCYEPGHNITGCPELKKAWAQDPTSYDGRRWQIFLDRKTRPKKCGYCDEDGHTRAGCGDLKAHKSLFVEDLVLWRHALVKWTKDTHLGIGALVRCTDASYYQDDVYMYPGEDNYEPALGMILYPINPALSHYSGIVNTNEWNNSNHSLFSFERLGADASLPEYRKTASSRVWERVGTERLMIGMIDLTTCSGRWFHPLQPRSKMMYYFPRAQSKRPRRSTLLLHKRKPSPVSTRLATSKGSSFTNI